MWICEGDIDIYNTVAMATFQTWKFVSGDFEADNMLRMSWNSTHIWVLMVVRHWKKAHKRAWKRRSIAPPFVKNGGVSFSYRHQTRYINCSNQAGQLSHLHSLATTNRKPAIFFFNLIFEEYQAVNKIILLQAETSSSHQTLSTWCQYTEDAKLLTDLGYLERCINGDLLKLQ